MNKLTKKEKEILSMDLEAGLNSLLEQYKNRNNKPVFKVLGGEESAVEHGHAQSKFCVVYIYDSILLFYYFWLHQNKKLFCWAIFLCLACGF